MQYQTVIKRLFWRFIEIILLPKPRCIKGTFMLYLYHNFLISKTMKGVTMKFKILTIAALMGIMPLISACSTTDYNANEERITVAKAQREIKIGMSSAVVVEVLGSPNMVTTDDQRRETWIYDRVSTNVQSSSSKNGVWLLLFAAGSKDAKTTSSQRTLTIIIKFDKGSKVRDFAYRTATF